MQHLDVHAHYHSHIISVDSRLFQNSLMGVQPLCAWCDLYTAANNWRAESQSGLTHEKYIPTYQFENTQKLLMIHHTSPFTIWNSSNFPSSICGLVHSGSRPFNYGTLKFTVSITCFLFIHFRRRSSRLSQLPWDLSCRLSISVYLCNK